LLSQLKNLLYNFVNILVMFVILRHFLYRPVSRFMNARKERIDGDIKRASESVANAEEARRRIIQDTENAKKEADMIMQKSAGEAQHAAQRILDDAREQAANIIEEAKAEAEVEKRRSVKAANDEIIDIAVNIAGRVLGREMSLDDNRALVEEFLKEMPENVDGA
jgi:F-type H+-transporting ATPase subunit b